MSSYGFVLTQVVPPKMIDNLLQICFKGTFEKVQIAIKVSTVWPEGCRCFEKADTLPIKGYNVKCQTY